MSLTAIPYNKTTTDIKNLVANVIFTEWKDMFAETNVLNVEDLKVKLNEIYACFAIVDNSDTLYGTVCINIDTPVATFNTNYWINNLYVIPAYRKKHIGAKILAFTEDYLYKKGISMGNLWCEQNLCDFYTKYQWIKSTGTYPGKPDSCVMIKMLSPSKHGIILKDIDLVTQGPEAFTSELY
jgi:GNAT superfamily N-acetyltransferase